jgi:hypothetical protein
MSLVSAGRALLQRVRRRRPESDPPVFWGKIGDYEAVTRRGMLLLLSPAPTHPSLRVKNGV